MDPMAVSTSRLGALLMELLCANALARYSCDMITLFVIGSTCSPVGFGSLWKTSELGVRLFLLVVALVMVSARAGPSVWAVREQWWCQFLLL
jgi:hypothetical protein